MRAQIQNFWATIHSSSEGDKLRGSLFFLLLGVYFVAAEYLSFRLFRAFFDVGGISIELLAMIMTMRLLSMIFLVVLPLLFFGAMIAAIEALYFGEDIDFLASMPISRTVILLIKLVSIYFTSAWVVFLVVMPVMVGYGRAVGNHFSHLPYSFIALVLFTIPPVAIASAFVIVLMRFLPVNKGKEGVLAAGALLSFGMIYIYRLLSPARLLKSGDQILADFTGFIREFSFPMSGLLPSSIMAQTLVNSVTGKWELFCASTTELGLAAISALVIYIVLGSLLFETDRPVSDDASGPGPLERMINRGGLIRKLSHLAPPGLRGLLYKEMTMHLRDPMQISHIFLMTGVVVLHFANLGEMPRFLGNEARILIAFLNLALVGFLTAGVAVRFIYPSISLEGKNLWKLEASPITPMQFVNLKFCGGWIPLTLASVIIVAGSNMVIGVDSRLFVLWIIAAIAMSTVISSLGISIGATIPAFDKKNVFEISSSPGGIIYMIISLLYVGLTIVLLVRPTYSATYFPSQFYSLPNMGAVAIVVVSACVITHFSQKIAAEAYEHFEERRITGNVS
ncbi:MAG: hypothetical protein JKX97_02955 [Candidatus Lindowbacteria bacterium]|nr:hypothetical protein [Candidatus Lindowbacteria bacterium]